MGVKIRPPSGALETEAPAEDANVIDVTPLDKAVNPFQYLAAVLARHKIPDARTQAVVDQQIAWLRALGQTIETGHDQPILLLAVGRLALDSRDRAWMRQVIDAIDTEGPKIAGQRQETNGVETGQ